jgi:hypothetical protein
MTELPSVSDAVQHSENERKNSLLNYEFLRQPVCSLFYLQSITIIPIIITTAIHAAHMTQTAAPSGMCKNFATIIANRLTIRRDSR